MQANGKIRADLIQHADACDAVGRAASTAEAQVRAIKTDWTKVQRMADTWGLTIHVDTGELSYIDPGTPEKRAEMERRADIVEAEIRSLITRANAADADLASAIRGAAGQETPAQIYDKLDDGAPPKESHPGEAEPEANRTYNQMKAFEKVFGHAPLSSADWATAAALDPHSYNAKNGGVPPNIVVGKIDKVPGQGVVRTNIFIPGEDVYSPPPTCPDVLRHEPGRQPRVRSRLQDRKNSRVAVVVDYENGIIVTRQNPSVNATTGEIQSGAPGVAATQQSNGSVLCASTTPPTRLRSAAKTSPRPFRFSVNGTLGIEPTANGPKIGGEASPRSPPRDLRPTVQVWRTHDAAAVVAVVRRRRMGAAQRPAVPQDRRRLRHRHGLQRHVPADGPAARFLTRRVASIPRCYRPRHR